MKKTVLLSLIILCVTMMVQAQPINFSWSKSMGGKAAGGSVGLAKDASGNLYVTGEFNGTRSFGTFSLTAIGSSDVYIAKYSSSGTCLWAIRGGGSFSSAHGGKIAVSGNEVYVTGSFTNSLEIGAYVVGSTGTKDIFVAGLDASNGTCMWLDKAGSLFDDIPYGIELATGGGFYLCGTFTGSCTFGSYVVSSSNITDYDIFYAKYTNLGVCSWVNRIGDTGTDKAFDLKELPSGDIILTGCFSGSVLFGPGTTLSSLGFTDFFLAQFNPSGNFTWATSGGCVMNDDYGFGLSYDPWGNIYATGYIGDTALFGPVIINNAGGINVLTAKFSSTGVCQWVQTGGNVFGDMGHSIVTDFGGSSYVTGYVTGDCYFGNTQLTGVNYMDVFVVKYDFNGALRWITRIGGSGVDVGRALLLDVNGYCHVAGDFEGNVVFGTVGLFADPGTTGIFLTRMGGGTVGIEEHVEMPFSAYPIPASDIIYLDIEKISDDGFTVSLINIEGKEVRSELISRNQVGDDYKFDTKNVTAGTYLLKVETSKGDFTKAVVIQ